MPTQPSDKERAQLQAKAYNRARTVIVTKYRAEFNKAYADECAKLGVKVNLHSKSKRRADAKQRVKIAKLQEQIKALQSALNADTPHTTVAPVAPTYEELLARWKSEANK